MKKRISQKQRKQTKQPIIYGSWYQVWYNEARQKGMFLLSLIVLLSVFLDMFPSLVSSATDVQDEKPQARAISDHNSPDIVIFSKISSVIHTSGSLQVSLLRWGQRSTFDGQRIQIHLIHVQKLLNVDQNATEICSVASDYQQACIDLLFERIKAYYVFCRRRYASLGLDEFNKPCLW